MRRKVKKRSQHSFTPQHCSLHTSTIAKAFFDSINCIIAKGKDGQRIIFTQIKIAKSVTVSKFICY